MQVKFKFNASEKVLVIEEKATKGDLINKVAKEFGLASLSVKIICIHSCKDQDLILSKLQAVKTKSILVIGTLALEKTKFDDFENKGVKMLEDAQEERQYGSFYIDVLEKQRRVELEKRHLTNVLYSTYQLGLVQWDSFSLQDARLVPMLEHAAYFGYKKRCVEILRHYLPRPIEVKTWEEYLNKSKEMTESFLRPYQSAIKTICKFAIASNRNITIKCQDSEPQLSSLQIVSWVLTEQNYVWAFAPSSVQDSFRTKCRPNLHDLIEYASSWSNQLQVMEFLYSLLAPKTRLTDIDASQAMSFGHLRQAKWLIERDAHVSSLFDVLGNGCIRTLNWFFDIKDNVKIEIKDEIKKETKDDIKDHVKDLADKFSRLQVKTTKLSPKCQVSIHDRDIVHLVQECKIHDHAPAILDMILPLLSAKTIETSCASLTLAHGNKIDTESKRAMIKTLTKTLGSSVNDSTLFLRACEHSPLSTVECFFSQLPRDLKPSMAIQGILAMKKRIDRLLKEQKERAGISLKPETDSRIGGRYSGEHQLAFAKEIVKNKEFNDKMRQEIQEWFQFELDDIRSLLVLFVSFRPENCDWEKIKQDIGENLLELFQNVLIKHVVS